MKPKPVSVEPTKTIIEPHDYVPAGLEGLARVAWLMDKAFKIPGLPMRVGLDAILGLLPIGGDFMTGLIQAGIVVTAMVRYKVPKVIAARMAANVLLDITLGSIPLLGDVFDTFFKANSRNIHLLTAVAEQQLLHQRVETRSSYLYLVGIAAAFFAVLSLVFIGFLTVAVWFYHHLSA